MAVRGGLLMGVITSNCRYFCNTSIKPVSADHVKKYIFSMETCQKYRKSHGIVARRYFHIRSMSAGPVELFL